ncbi:unnamed protein product [Linum trigynum]|uniref:Uncharacterized protein n=1 Tax=Linum trigynum TaxID=586398 RepID=A0AAV2GDP8_9ROSI
MDTSNFANQLDQNFRKFFLAGNPQREIQGQRGQPSRHLYRGGEKGRGSGAGGQEQRFGNIFQAFDEQFLAEAFNIDTDLARRIKNEQFSGKKMEDRVSLGLIKKERR